MRKSINVIYVWKKWIVRMDPKKGCPQKLYLVIMNFMKNVLIPGSKEGQKIAHYVELSVKCRVSCKVDSLINQFFMDNSKMQIKEKEEKAIFKDFQMNCCLF